MAISGQLARTAAILLAKDCAALCTGPRPTWSETIRPKPCDHSTVSTASGKRSTAMLSRRALEVASNPPAPSAVKITPRGGHVATGASASCRTPMQPEAARRIGNSQRYEKEEDLGTVPSIKREGRFQK